MNVSANKLGRNLQFRRLFDFINIVFIILFVHYFALNIFGDIYKFIVSAVFFAPMILLGLFLLPRINRKFKDISPQSLNRALAVMNVISFALMLVFAIVMRTEYYNDANEYVWDYGMVCDTAYRYAKYGELCVVDPNILPRYPNNHCIIYFLYYVFKLVHFIFPNMSVNGYQLIAVVINCLFIETAVIFTLKLASKLLSPKKVFACGCLLCTCIPIYAYAPFYYTDTLAMPFVVGLLYVYVCACEEKSAGKKILLALLFSVLLVIGFQIKATVIFVAAAVLFDMIFRRKTLKVSYKHILIVLVSFMLRNNCLSNVYSKTLGVTEEDYDTHKYPVTHWVMMALNEEGRGSWVRTDDFLTRNAGNYDDKVEANIDEIKRRVDDMGAWRMVKHVFYTKAFNTWAASTLSADRFLSLYPKHENILHKFFTYTGKYHPLYVAASMLWHSALMLLVALSAIKNYAAKSFDKMLIIFLPLLILALFLMVWESDARYIFHMFPLMLIAGADSLDFVLKISEKFNSKVNSIRHKAA